MKYNICNVNEGENLFFTILWYILEKDLTKSGENIIDGGIITNNVYFRFRFGLANAINKYLG